MNSPRVSILIPTVGDTHRLERFLSQLVHFAASPNVEILIVANCPEIPANLTALAASTQTKLLHEPQRGKSRALNLGIAESKGDWLVFTDDDVRLPGDWLIRLLPPDIPADVNIIGGRTLNDGVGPHWIERSRNLQELLLCRHDLGDRNMRYGFGKYPIGPNMAVRRTALLAASARWPVNQGPGTSLPVGDESVFLSQISPPEDSSRLYLADAVVYHPIDDRYIGLKAAARRAYQGGYASGLLNAQLSDTDAGGSSANGRALHALRRLRSINEFVCSLTRAAGFYIGRGHGRQRR